MFGLSDNVVEELREVFRRYGNIRRVLIFGSRAKARVMQAQTSTLPWMEKISPLANSST